MEQQPETSQEPKARPIRAKPDFRESDRDEKAKDDSTDVHPYSETHLGLSLIKNIALDQRAAWTSPTQLRLEDANWLAPLAGVTAGSLAADTGLSKALTGSPAKVRASTAFSNYGIGGFAAATGGIYLLGKLTHDDHESETGLLSGEAAVDAVGVTTALQYAFGRQRPTDGNGGGGFWRHGTSFPSDHSAAAWAVASVMAHEYPGPLTKLLYYGLASAVSISRVTGKDHFPSDVLIGGGIGWFTGRHVFLAHHDPELGGGPWGSPLEDQDETAGKSGLADRNAASSFVSLDSWVYAAFNRLAAMGFATSTIEGEKPWTRMECARLTEQVGDALVDSEHEGRDPDEQAVQLHDALQSEFAQEIEVLDGGRRNQSFGLDSVYTRVLSISGPILTDGENFGQTISYDFGRPFRRGANALAGASARASEGPLAFFVRVEYQHSPSAPPLPASVLQFISTNDRLPLQSPHPFDPVNRADLLEGYATFNHSGWQVTAGKEALSWNVGVGGSMLFSDNAEPLYMVRLTRVDPLDLPGFLAKLGRLRTDWFLGKLEGGLYIPQPLLFGHKFSLDVTPFLEIGFGRTTTLGRGPNALDGDPFTAHNLFASFFGVHTTLAGSVPGDSNFEFDVNLHLPWFRHLLTLYCDCYTDDQPTYLYDPPRGAYRAGMFLSRLPHLPRADLRVEAISTESPVFDDPYGGLLNYWNFTYRDGPTNYGKLFTNTVSRQGRLFEGWTTFHISALQDVQFSFSDHQIDPHFVPGGGLWQDYKVSHEIHLPSGFYAKSSMQIEHIQHYPVLFPGSVNNITASVEIGMLFSHARL